MSKTTDIATLDETTLEPIYEGTDAEIDDLSEDYPGQHITGPETATRKLDFTVVHGYLRGDHAKAFELHATGCRDLRSKQAKKLFSFNVYAPTPEAALAEVCEDTQTKSSDYHVQPCTLLKRMQAIGRA